MTEETALQSWTHLRSDWERVHAEAAEAREALAVAYERRLQSVGFGPTESQLKRSKAAEAKAHQVNCRVNDYVVALATRCM